VASPPNMVPSSYSNPESVREFRAQRNMYICGMSLFLWFVIRRLIVLIVETANLVETCEKRVVEIDVIRTELSDLMRSGILQKKSLADNDMDSAADKNLEYDLNKKELRQRSRSRGKKEM
jgi:hypothetical protein